MAGSPFQIFYQSMMSSYIARYVRAEPQPPTDWSRPRSQCDCQDCRPLSTFLVSPTQEKAGFSIPAKRREHLQEQCKRMGGFIFSTDRDSLPMTLLITKDLSAYKKAHSEWTERRKTAKIKIMEFRQEILHKLLDDRFEAITTLNVAGNKTHQTILQNLTPPPPQPTPPLSSIITASPSSRTLPPITKRKTPMPIPEAAEIN